jgi:hypothetical protein
MYYVFFFYLSDSTKLSILSHKQHYFREEVDPYETCVLIFCTNLSKTFIVMRRIQQDIIINIHRSSRIASVIQQDIIINILFLIDLLHRQYIQNVKR